MNNTDKYWFPLKLKHRKEYIVFSRLLKKGYKSYLPLIRYVVKKNERNIWKIKPIFKGIIFIYCTPEDLHHLQLVDASIKPFYNGKEPKFVYDTRINFIKKAFVANEFIDVIPREINGTPYIDIETVEFGDINLMKSYYKENEVITWIMPVIKYTLIFNKNSSFIKYVILESQNSLVKI